MTEWRKSSRSNSDPQGACVELAALDAHVGIRDSKNHRLPYLRVTPAAFRRLIDRIKHDIA